jgi:AbiV family abortive infection protein
MSSKKLNGYRGRLTASQAAAGMNAATENAKRLQEDAQALLDAGRASTAASLAALSIEESGKVSILRQLATATTSEEVAAAWKSYRSHTRKNVQWLLPDLAVKGARKLEDFRSLFEVGAEHPVVLDHVKQLGFYTDCLGNCHWSVPTEVVDSQLAKSLVQIAKLLVRRRETTVTEIELWVTHVGSASKGDLSAMKQALVAWYAAMQEAGLYQSGINEMERFIHDGVPMPDV